MHAPREILVTGGAGFAGAHLALGLKGAYPDVRVTALDNLKRRGSELNLPRLRAGGVEFVHGDVRNPEDLEGAGTFDLMIECSAEPSVLAGYASAPSYALNTNLVGTLHCLEAVRRNEAAILFLSTSRVYPLAKLRGLSLIETPSRFELAPAQPFPGASGEGIAEDFPLEGARSLYGATKLCSELMLTEYAEMYGIPAIVNRCGVLTGPWQMGKVDQGVAVLWAARHCYGGPLRYIGYGGEGKQVRDMLHIEDLLGLVLLQIAHFDALRGQIFNVGGGRDVSVSLQELTALCQYASGKTIDIAGEAENRDADIPVYLTDHTKVTEATGWRPERTPQAIIEEICAWLRDEEAMLRPILGA